MPKTAIGIRYRNLVTGSLRIPAVADLVIGRDLRDNLTIPTDINMAPLQTQTR